MKYYIIIFTLLILFSVLYLKLAEYFNIIDKPNQRSSHTIPTIRGGGILFLIALWLFFLSSNFEYPYLVLGTTLVGGISFIDDLKTLSSRLRLPFQFLAILLILIQVGLLGIPWWIISILVIIGVGFINIYNFMDGINGITGLYSLSVLLGFYLINTNEQIVHPNLLIYLALSLLVFGYYNFRRKARFFAGDIGSISIAVIFYFMGCLFIYELEAPIILLLIVVYGTDAVLTVVYRKSIGEHIMEPHRHHIYQKLIDFYKIPHLLISIGYTILQLMVNYVVYKSYSSSHIVQYSILLAVFVFFIFLYIGLFFLIKNKKARINIK